MENILLVTLECIYKCYFTVTSPTRSCNQLILGLCVSDSSIVIESIKVILFLYVL